MSGLQKMNVGNLYKIPHFKKTIMRCRTACIYIKISRMTGNKTSISTSFDFLKNTSKMSIKASYVLKKCLQQICVQCSVEQISVNSHYTYVMKYKCANFEM